MAKLKNSPISSADLNEFLATSSDFAFELLCLERLSRLGFECQHGGSYVDRLTGKDRQFDIRAQRSVGLLRVRLAVECKNLTESFPLVVMSVPRSKDESFHEIVFAFDPKTQGSGSTFDAPAFRPNSRAIHVAHPDSEYLVNAPVGKATAQVGRACDNNSIVANDAEVFEKWSQALASANDLANEAAEEGQKNKGLFMSLVLPVLVVPDGTLWRVNFSETGARVGEPVRTERCSFFVGRRYNIGNTLNWASLTISHLEFVTVSGLEHLAAIALHPRSLWFPAFPRGTEPRTPTGEDQPSSKTESRI